MEGLYFNEVPFVGVIGPQITGLFFTLWNELGMSTDSLENVLQEEGIWVNLHDSISWRSDAKTALSILARSSSASHLCRRAVRRHISLRGCFWCATSRPFQYFYA